MSQFREDIFDNFVRLKRGYDLPNQNIVYGTYPIIASTHVKDYHNAYKAEPPGVVTGRSGSLGDVQYINSQYWPLNTTLYVKDFKGNFPRYVFYFLKTMHLENFNSGAGVPTLNQNHLHKVKIKVPSLQIQEKIAAVLSAYDDLIGINNRRITLLEKVVKEIYSEWFLRMRFPGHKKVKFYKGMPEGWEYKKTSFYFNCIKGKSYSSNEISDTDGAMPFINLKSFNRGGGYRRNGLKYYSGRYSERQVVCKGDIVMAVTDMTQERAVVGRVARIPDIKNAGAVISLDVIKIVPTTISNTFLYTFLKHSGFGDYIKEFANGANVLHLKPDVVTQQRVLLPPKILRDKLDSLVTPIYQKSDSLNLTNGNLKKNRELLLPRLISGKLSVEDLNIEFPPTMKEEMEVAHA